jgi:pSer/pThr/pTyr-binding forkhead associated (FHA) protein
MAKLLLKFNAAVIKEIVLDKPSFTIGRKADNDLVIDNPAVSGHHARLVLSGDAFFIEDLESTNGTFVNEKRVVKSGLRHNDVVGIAKHALVFLDEKPPAAADKTVVLSPQALAESAQATRKERIGTMRVLKGGDRNAVYELKSLSTYIGKSDRVQIPIQGSGFFSQAPEVAASVHRKAEGYTLVAVKPGYPSVNGERVDGQVPLKDGDILEVGATTLLFSLKEG